MESSPEYFQMLHKNKAFRKYDHFMHPQYLQFQALKSIYFLVSECFVLVTPFVLYF